MLRWSVRLVTPSASLHYARSSERLHAGPLFAHSKRGSIMHLQGKAAVVTGAGRGIGREVAKLLAAEGASVVVNDPGVGRGGEQTEERPAADVVAEIRKAGGKAVAN